VDSEGVIKDSEMTLGFLVLIVVGIKVALTEMSKLVVEVLFFGEHQKVCFDHVKSLRFFIAF
jgi:hypothetical protein